MCLTDFKTVAVGKAILPQKCLYTRRINGFYVPCGKCEFCLKQRAREWAFRLEAESFDKYTYNVLLTYADKSLPYYNGEPTVSKVHIQDFLKRFRYYVDKVFHTKIKFFLAAEYGGKFHRPHYHMLVFSELPLHIKSPDPYAKILDLLERAWKHGICDIEPLKNLGGGVNYLVSYMTSYADGRKYVKQNKPFLLMSRSGLGKSWIDKHPKLVNKMIATMEYTYTKDINGNKVVQSLPRYLMRKIMPEEQQIARADAYYEYSQNFENQLNKLNYEERNKRFAEIKKERSYQREREREQYRAKKLHVNNANTGKLSNRVKRRKE